MPTIDDLKKQANQLRHDKKYSEALPLFKQLWEENRDSCNEWEGWSYAFCLKQLKEYKPSLEICREVYKIKPTFDNIKGLIICPVSNSRSYNGYFICFSSW